MATKKKQRIAGVDVFLYINQEGTGDDVGFVYELESARYNRVVFTLDFDGSENFNVEPSDAALEHAPALRAEASTGEPLALRVVAEPFTRVTMGKLVLVNPTVPASLVNSYKVRRRANDDAPALAAHRLFFLPVVLVRGPRRPDRHGARGVAPRHRADALDGAQAGLWRRLGDHRRR